MQDITLLQQQIGYSFKDISLLKCALTHKSYGRPNYERLEFVGDSILDYVIALSLYHRYPDLAEGELSKVRAALVNQDALCEIAKQLDLGKYLLLGDGEVKSGGRSRASILADVLEAVFAAISLDSDFATASKIIETMYYERLSDIKKIAIKDSKSVLQELLQARKINVPDYNVIELTGPDHDSTFCVECKIPELNMRTVAEGKTKKEASQRAADEILKQLKEIDWHD